MSTVWAALVLAALVLLLTAVWLGSLFYWANQHGPEQRALYRDMVRAHALDLRERHEVQEAVNRGVALETPAHRAAVLDWARRALTRDLELRGRHPRGSLAVVVLYVMAGGCLVAAVVSLFVDGRTRLSAPLLLTLDFAWVVLLAARPFLRRRNWRRAVERNSTGAPTAAD